MTNRPEFVCVWLGLAKIDQKSTFFNSFMCLLSQQSEFVCAKIRLHHLFNSFYFLHWKKYVSFKIWLILSPNHCDSINQEYLLLISKA
jgi:hypothetical protein